MVKPLGRIRLHTSDDGAKGGKLREIMCHGRRRDLGCQKRVTLFHSELRGSIVVLPCTADGGGGGGGFKAYAGLNLGMFEGKGRSGGTNVGISNVGAKLEIFKRDGLK